MRRRSSDAVPSFLHALQGVTAITVFTALKSLKPKPFASGARLAAAMAVVRERSPCKGLGALMYRVLEVSAHALLPAVMTWVVEPAAIGVVFVLFWYLPAVWHLRSCLKPLAFPLLAFVVDDFSILGLHPTPRDAKVMYRIMVLRVSLLLAALPLLAPITSPLPEPVRTFFFDQATWDMFDRRKKLDDYGLLGAHVAMAPLWITLSASVVILSVLWLLVAIHMLCVTDCLGMKSPIVGEVSGDLVLVQEIAEEVDATKYLNDKDCHGALQRLKEQYPHFMLTNVFNTIGPAVGFLLRLSSTGMSIGVFVMAAFRDRDDLGLAAGNALSALALCTTMTITLVQLGLRHPEAVFREVRRSWARGVHTEGYLAIVRADKGSQAIPALFVKVYGLPFAATSVFSVLVSWGSILVVVGTVSLFVFQQFDLGIEKEGGEEERCFDDARSSFTSATTSRTSRAHSVLVSGEDVGHVELAEWTLPQRGAKIDRAG